MIGLNGLTVVLKLHPHITFFLRTKLIMSGNDMSGDILISNGDYCLYTYFFSFMLMRPGKMVLLLTLGFCMFMSELSLRFFIQACQKTKSYRKNKRWCDISS